MSKWSCSIDTHSRVVMRNRKAVALTFLEFAIFHALHHDGRNTSKRVQSRTLLDKVYNGVAEPSGIESVRNAVNRLNAKLMHIGLQVRGHNHGCHSFYQIVLV